jgi:hypothetical protein
VWLSSLSRLYVVSIRIQRWNARVKDLTVEPHLFLLSNMPGGNYLSRQTVMLMIIDYLAAKEQELGLGVSAHYIKTKIPGLPGQTSERLAEMLEELVKRNYINKNSYEGDKILYKISEKGKQECREWGIKALEFYGGRSYKLTKPR